MLKSDREYLAKFALDPETENELDEIDLFFDDEMETTHEDGEFDSLIDSRIEMEGRAIQHLVVKHHRGNRVHLPADQKAFKH